MKPGGQVSRTAAPGPPTRIVSSPPARAASGYQANQSVAISIITTRDRFGIDWLPTPADSALLGKRVVIRAALLAITALELPARHHIGREGPLHVWRAIGAHQTSTDRERQIVLAEHQAIALGSEHQIVMLAAIGDELPRTGDRGTCQQWRA